MKLTTLKVKLVALLLGFSLMNTKAIGVKIPFIELCFLAAVGLGIHSILDDVDTRNKAKGPDAILASANLQKSISFGLALTVAGYILIELHRLERKEEASLNAAMKKKKQVIELLFRALFTKDVFGGDSQDSETTPLAWLSENYSDLPDDANLPVKEFITWAKQSGFWKRFAKTTNGRLWIAKLVEVLEGTKNSDGEGFGDGHDVVMSWRIDRLIPAGISDVITN